MMSTGLGERHGASVSYVIRLILIWQKTLLLCAGTKENQKRQGILLQGLPNKKLAWGGEHKEQDAEMVGMAEDRGDANAMLMEWRVYRIGAEGGDVHFWV